MDKLIQKKIDSCTGNDGCAPDLADGKAIVDKVRQVKLTNGLLEIPHFVICVCGNKFEMVHFEEKCSKCGMVYGVTPCSSHDVNNIKPSGINY